MDEHYDEVNSKMGYSGKGEIASAIILTTTTIKREEGGRPEKSLRQPLLADQHAINHPPRPVSERKFKGILTGVIDMYHTRSNSPLLNSVEGLDLRNRDKDDNSLLSTLGVNLLCRRDLELPQLGLELWDILLEVDEGLSDSLLNLRWCGFGCVGGPLDLGLERHDG